jgi:ATP-binding cassette subfamily B (MDR/TAP) protein 9
VRTITFIFIAFTFLFIISWKLTLTFLGVLIPVIVFGAIYGKRVKELQKDIQKKKASCSEVAEESFANIRTVKSFSNEADEMKKY